MTAKAPALTDILTMLIRSDKKTHRTLERGLTLAYTPGSLNGGIHRLTLSRKGIFPSEQEIEIVKRDLYKVLSENGRFPEIISVESYLKKPLKRGVMIYYHILFWREGVQERLL